MSSSTIFSAELFKYLRELSENNDKAWFDAHRDQYETVYKLPAQHLIREMADCLKPVSGQLIADPRGNGGSLFRIFRDTRFSKDKRPYKTHVGMRFFHAATQKASRAQSGNAAPGRLDAPLLYLHIEPGHCFAGGGIWHPQANTLKRIRGYLVNQPNSWSSIQQTLLHGAYDMGGERLQRVPRGYAPDHPLADDLKRKDFVASTPLTEQFFLEPHLAERLTDKFQPIAPLLDYLCDALDLEF